MRRNEKVNGEIWTLCGHKVFIMGMNKEISVEELQAEGQHLLLQEDLLGVYLNLAIETVVGSPLLFGVIYIAWVYDHWLIIWKALDQW